MFCKDYLSCHHAPDSGVWECVSFIYITCYGTEETVTGSHGNNQGILEGRE